MLTITVCVQSSCYARGSEAPAARLAALIQERGLAAAIEMTGAVCMDGCSTGVSVSVGSRTYHAIDPAGCDSFFEEEVIPCLEATAAYTPAAWRPQA